VDIGVILNSMFAMRPLSVLLGLAYLAGNAVFALLMVFLATFPFENQSPEDAGKDDWLIGVAVLLLALALVTALAILLRRVALALIGYVVAAGLGVALLVWAVGESEHSDGKLLLWGTLIELAGLAAVAVTPRREPGSQGF
jgi:Na+/melibiose symporter-like transporter